MTKEKKNLTLSNDFPMLTSEAASDIKEYESELQDTFQKRQMFRTETEMRFSVLNDGKFATPAAKYWQAVREQSVMYGALVQLSFEYRKKLLELKKAKTQLQESSNEFDMESAQIDIDQAQWHLENMRLTGVDRVREIKLWSSLKKECIEADPTFDTKNVNTHQFDSLKKTLENRKASLTPGSSQAEVLNVLGPLATMAKQEKMGSSIIDAFIAEDQERKSLANSKKE